jgi:hypothetical protein
MLPDQVRLTCLLERLRELERRDVPEHERPILEVGCASLREAIREVSHRLHDRDYCQPAGEYGDGTGPGRSRTPGGLPATVADWRQLHDEADIRVGDDDLA